MPNSSVMSINNMLIKHVLLQPLSTLQLATANNNNYSPKAKHSFKRIMEILYGQKMVFTRTTPQKWTDFDETWSIVSTLLGAGPHRFWAQTAQ